MFDVSRKKARVESVGRKADFSTPLRYGRNDGFERRGVSLRLRRWMQAGLVCLLAVVMLGADPSSRFNKMGHEMICTCGCGQILLECNHVGCPVSPVMINELHAQMDGGGSDTLILNWFAAKYGATVLAAPIRGGFDNVAWIAPMAAFLLATVGLAFLIRMWTGRSGRRVPVSAAGPDVGGDALRERIRRETEY
jgi:cytochrome c-type biogenesis protein CcmH/NrfF